MTEKIFPTNDDDPLRCLRIASCNGSEIEPETLSEMRRNVSRLEIISPELIRDELAEMLTCDNPIMAMELLRETGAMRTVIPELCETFTMGQNHYHFGTVWEHTLRVVEGVPADLTLRMAALLHDIGKIRTRRVDENGGIHFIGHERASARLAGEILQRLKYSPAFIREVEFLVHHHMDLKGYGDDAGKLKDKKLRKIQYLCRTAEEFDSLLTLIDADNRAHAEGFCMPRQAEIIRERTRRMVDEGSAMFGYRIPFTEQDVVRIKGLPPGPAVRECMDYVLKLAFVNPLRPLEDFEKHLRGYHVSKRK